MLSGNILINLVSAQPIPSLIPALDPRFAVTEVILLVTEQMHPQAKRLTRVFKRHDLPCRTWEETAPPFDPQEMEELCFRVIESFPDGQSLLLNATGGTKMMALAAANLFSSLDRGNVIYVDTAQGLIHFLYPSREKAFQLEPVLSISDYLTAYGLHPKIPRKIWRRGDALPVVPTSARLLAENADFLDTFIGVVNFAGTGVLDSGRASEAWPRKIFLDRSFSRSETVIRVLSQLEHEDMLSFDRNNLVTIVSEEAARYVSGGWLEEYVFARACAAGADEVSWSQVVDWDDSGNAPIANEFDCLIMRNNRLYLLECKTSRFSAGASEVVYKLDSLKDKIAGIYGLGALVSARPLPEHILSRAAARKHQVFSPEELKGLTSVLKEWLDGRP